MSPLVELMERRFAVYRIAATGQVDRYGKPITARTLIGTWRGSLQPVKSAEGEAFVVGTFNFYVEPAADLRPADEFEEGGQVYKIDGAPFLNKMTPASLNHWSGVARHVGPVSP